MKLKKMWLKAPVSEDGDTNLGIQQAISKTMDRSRRACILAPKSPDLNPLDYFLWDHIEKLVYRVVREDEDLACMRPLLPSEEMSASFIRQFLLNQ
ncbi:hypothetical protein ANN_23798 [Periplaneta americana]|uniref:Tc1-like transposase DDE domain-containing protein n=1 Tax=Periplaneta americana TaxID=6978 RepID=A0ABQ8SM43_PERAM|nr:hypothetical protein ANN_23798 [Periplaneta americana]